MSEIVKQSDLTKIKDRFVNLTNEKTFELEASFALQHINKSSQLLKCSKGSLISAVMNVANFGLTLNPVKKEAFLVPRYDRNRGYEAYLEPSYMGMIKAVTELGGVLSVEAHIVFEGDIFEPMLGTEGKIKHIPQFKSKIITHAYAVATLASKSKQFEIMGLGDLHEIRDTSTSWIAYKKGKISSCIWKDWESEMCRKTVIRRLVKYLPRGNNDRLMDLVAADETDYQPEFSMQMYAHELIDTSTYDDEAKGRFDNQVDELSKPELEMLIIDLQANQLPVTEIYAPTQNELAKAIKDKE